MKIPAGSLLLILCSLLILPTILRAQKTSDLFKHLEVQKTYENAYRSLDGTPGPNYFINRIDYNIKAEFNPQTRVLKGTQQIKYTNNSPDSLDRLVFNLYQDLYKKGNARDWDMGTHDLTDGVQIQKVAINGKKIDLDSDDYRNNMSIMTIRLPEKLPPGNTLLAETDWYFTVAEKVSVRQGMYGKGNFFIAYWYPKIAVYDDLVGWDTRGHTGRAEFYNDFGDYEYQIKVPAEYTVWGNGILQNAQDILTKKYYDRYKKAHDSDEVISIIGENDRKSNAQIQKKADYHVWKFKMENTPDVCFALSKSYYWDGVRANNGERDIFVQSAYKPESPNFYEVCEISKLCVEYFSLELPAIPFPYPQLTAFNGRGGMEFPGMVNDSEVSTRDGTMYLTAHEIGHSYFPFAAGLDEQMFAWMDEGLITYFPRHFVHKYSHSEDPGYLQSLISAYNQNAGSFTDMPMVYPSADTGRAYRFQAYTRPGTAFYVLSQELGKDKFYKALREFYKRWEGKHPKGFDLFYTFNEVVGEDLAWFWKPWFFEPGYPDLAIEMSPEGNLLVHNKGYLPVPVRITITFEDGKTQEIYESAKVWRNENKTLSIELPEGVITLIKTDTDHIPDINPEDNKLIFR